MPLKHKWLIYKNMQLQYRYRHVYKYAPSPRWVMWKKILTDSLMCKSSQDDSLPRQFTWLITWHSFWIASYKCSNSLSWWWGYLQMITERKQDTNKNLYLKHIKSPAICLVTWHTTVLASFINIFWNFICWCYHTDKNFCFHWKHR